VQEVSRLANVNVRRSQTLRVSMDSAAYGWMVPSGACDVGMSAPRAAVQGLMDASSRTILNAGMVSAC
jgi:hypothetical protein